MSNSQNLLKTDPSEGRARVWLALGVTGVSILGVVTISLVVILVSSRKEEAAQMVFTAVLPLLGTWVGTVMAYFFSRENFESASRSVQEMSRQLSGQEKLKTISAASVMIPRSRMLVCQNTETTLHAILEQLNARNVKRLPILKADDTVESLIYQTDIIDYLFADEAAPMRGIDDRRNPMLTIADMLRDKPDAPKPYALVSESATLADAQEALFKDREARVIFVTQTGAGSSPVVGMLTAVDIAKEAQT